MCGLVSELGSKLVSCTAERINMCCGVAPPPLYPPSKPSPPQWFHSRIACPHTSLPLGFQMVFFCSQCGTVTDKNSCTLWFISGVSAGGVALRLFMGFSSRIIRLPLQRLIETRGRKREPLLELLSGLFLFSFLFLKKKQQINNSTRSCKERNKRGAHAVDHSCLIYVMTCR